MVQFNDTWKNKSVHTAGQVQGTNSSWQNTSGYCLGPHVRCGNLCLTSARMLKLHRRMRVGPRLRLRAAALISNLQPSALPRQTMQSDPGCFDVSTL